jgi:hypothetical protein
MFYTELYPHTHDFLFWRSMGGKVHDLLLLGPMLGPYAMPLSPPQLIRDRGLSSEDPERATDLLRSHS